MSTRNSAIFRFALTVVAMACAASAFAVVRTNTLVNGKSNWNDPNSYTDTSFVPSTNDVVVIPENATVYLNSSDTTSFNIMSNLSYLVFTHTNSVLEITVPEGGDALFDCKFKGLWEPNGNGQFYSGLIVKKGKGRITAGDGSKYPAGVNIKYYRLPLRIEEGTWRCAQNIPNSAGKQEDYSIVDVAKGAFFCLNSGKLGYTTVLRLSGAGTVTTTGGEQRQLRIGTVPVPVSKYDPVPCEFAGVFDTGVKYFSNGRVFLTGTNSLMTVTPTVFGGNQNYATNNGYTAVMKFGKAGEPSSIGTSDTVDINSRGGGWGYLGKGETTDKVFRWYPNTDGPSMLLDGGAHGGLIFTGQWKPASHGISSIVLTGSNTVSACVVDCPIQLSPTTPSSGWGVGSVSNFPVSVTKTGTGKWRFTHNVNRHLLGVFDIQQGTIQADTFEEAGIQSSLGYATNMFLEGFSNTVFEYPENKRVRDYAFVLGAEASDSIAGVATEGTLEYTGDKSAYCFTRPYVLDGDARFKNSTSHRFWTGQVRSRSAGAKTLTLDGNSANTNLIADITDVGKGAISIAKEGSGTWIVSGTNDIRGDITVKAGTLILQNINSQQITWHKWVIRSNWSNVLDPGTYDAGQGKVVYETSGRYAIRIEEFGLFNSSGTRLNVGLTYCDDFIDLEPGQAAYSTPRHARYGTVTSREYIDAWFDRTTATGKQNFFYYKPNTSGASALNPDDPISWRSVTMRLADGVGEAVSWDYANTFGEGNEFSGKVLGVRSSTLYGSANGVDWEILAVADEVPLAAAGGFCWSFDGRRSDDTKGVHTNCNTIATRVAQNAYPFLNNMVGAVSVASGAVLECQGAPITFAKLKLDAAGAGTIKNAAFAASGEIAVENVQTKDDMVFSSLFDGCVDADNLAGWTIRENGKVTTRLRAQVRGGNLRLIRNGFVLIYR